MLSQSSGIDFSADFKKGITSLFCTFLHGQQCEFRRPAHLLFQKVLKNIPVSQKDFSFLVEIFFRSFPTRTHWTKHTLFNFVLKPRNIIISIDKVNPNYRAVNKLVHIDLKKIRDIEYIPKLALFHYLFNLFFQMWAEFDFDTFCFSFVCFKFKYTNEIIYFRQQI